MQGISVFALIFPLVPYSFKIIYTSPHYASERVNNGLFQLFYAYVLILTLHGYGVKRASRDILHEVSTIVSSRDIWFSGGSAWLARTFTVSTNSVTKSVSTDSGTLKNGRCNQAVE